MKCEICDKEIDKKGLPSHVKRTHKIESKEYYDKYIKKKGEGTCPICGKDTPFIGISSGYHTCCSKICSSRYGLKQVKSKYGVENISQVPDISKKMSISIKNSWKSLSQDKYESRCRNISIGTKNSNCKETKKQSRDRFEKENDCTSVPKLINLFGTGWYQAEIIPKEEQLYFSGVYFIKNSDIAKIKTYFPKPRIQSTSKKEKELVNYVKSIYKGKIIENDRKVIYPLELDIYIPDKQIAIEFNGIYWHSDKVIHKKYHLEKSKLCEKKGIRLIHIYEWEIDFPYWEKIKMMLNQAFGNNPTLYARNCEIKEISNKDARVLNNIVHLQGHRNAQVTYGLFYHNELVQLMSFSKTRYNKNLKDDNSWEIIRGCPGSNISVVGGVSKLFKHFIKTHLPNKIFSYCDFNKFDGNSYEKLGMKFIGYTGPDKTWIINGKPIKRNPKRYKELKASSDAIVWGSGSKKYEITFVKG